MLDAEFNCQHFFFSFFVCLIDISEGVEMENSGCRSVSHPNSLQRWIAMIILEQSNNNWIYCAPSGVQAFHACKAVSRLGESMHRNIVEVLPFVLTAMGYSTVKSADMKDCFKEKVVGLLCPAHLSPPEFLEFLGPNAYPELVNLIGWLYSQLDCLFQGGWLILPQLIVSNPFRTPNTWTSKSDVGLHKYIVILHPCCFFF